MASQVRAPSTESFFREKREFKKRDAKGWPIGKRTERRSAENRELNKLPDSIKRRCEIRIPGVCIGDRMLSWAHSKKSRFLVTSKDWQECARSCCACHDFLDNRLSHAEMKKAVTDAINNRSTTE